MRLFFIFSLYIIPIVAVASNIPNGFEGFYEYKPTSIVIISPLGKKKVFEAEISYENIKLSDDEKNKLFDLIIDDNVKTSIVKKVINNISNVSFYNVCDEDELLKCSLSNDDISFSYLYDKKMLKINVSGNDFRQNSKEYKYAKTGTDAVGLISHVSANTFGNKANGSDASIQGNIYVDTQSNIGYGYVNNYISADTNGGFDLDEFSYNTDFKGYSVALGYYNGSGYSDDILSDYEYQNSSEKFKVAVYSSSNLLIGQKKSYKRVYFNMPDNGYVNFYRDGRVFKNKYFESGQQFITYSDLPYGNYDLGIEFVIDGKINNKKIYKKIYNSKNDVSGLNYKAEIASLKNENNSSLYNKNDIKYFNYGKLGLLYGFNENIGLLSEVIFSDDSNVFSVGFIYNSNFNVVLKNTIVNDIVDGNRVELSADYEGFSASYEKVDHSGDVSSVFFSGEYFGYDNYENYGLTYSKYINGNSYLPSGTLYFNYDHMERHVNKNSLLMNYFKSDMYSLSYNFSYKDNQFNLMMSKSYSNNDVDEFSLNFDIEIPLGNEWGLSNSVSFLDDSISLRNELYHNYSSENVNIQSSIYSLYQSKENVTSGASVNGSYSDSYQRIMGSIDVNSDRTSAYASFDTNVLVSAKGVLFSEQNADSYIVIDSESNVDVGTDYGTYELDINNGEQYLRGNISSDNLVLGNRSFNKYDVILDTESSNLENDGERLTSYFSHPGTIKYINPKLTEIKTYIVSFEYFNTQKIKNIQCKGNGCSSYSEIGDGVFSLSVKVGEAFKIYTDESICFIEQVANNTNLGVSKCLPSIKDEDGMQLVTKGLGDEFDNHSYYIGTYNKEEIARISSKVDGEIVAYDYNNKNYVFWIPENIKDVNNKNIYDVIAKFDNHYENYATILK
ncbi:TcfC E-set like domain-containing protein [Photobacterium damselae]|uniref:TcfC E-set like domain-containing protein n=1 Tax=Photobacterium damselae TaxID=38293 RepID=UPI004068B725